MLNKHGLKMRKVRSAAKETEKAAKGGLRTQITYNTSSGVIYAQSNSQSSWVLFDDPSFLSVCFTSEAMTPQEIADMVFKAVEEQRQTEEDDE